MVPDKLGKHGCSMSLPNLNTKEAYVVCHKNNLARQLFLRISMLTEFYGAACDDFR